MKYKNQIFFIIIFLIIAVIYVFIAQKQGAIENQKAYNRFYKTNINGKIENMEIGKYAAHIKIEGINDEFLFYPLTSKINNFEIFDRFAKKGDILEKPSYADTLKLIKNGKAYLYTFRKF